MVNVGIREIENDVVYVCTCDECGKEFIVPSDSLWHFKYCSIECVEAVNEKHRQERNKRFIEQRRERNKRIRAAMPDNICEHCQGSFRPVRSTAKYCSDKCRQAAYRERKAHPET